MVDIRKAPSYPQFLAAHAAFKANQTKANARTVAVQLDKCLAEIGSSRRLNMV